MRLVAKHSAVGYEPPQDRDSCRHCTQLDIVGDERPGFSKRWMCKKHDFEINVGGCCPSFLRRSVSVMVAYGYGHIPKLGSAA